MRMGVVNHLVKAEMPFFPALHFQVYPSHDICIGGRKGNGIPLPNNLNFTEEEAQQLSYTKLVYIYIWSNNQPITISPEDDT